MVIGHIIRSFDIIKFLEAHLPLIRMYHYLYNACNLKPYFLVGSRSFLVNIIPIIYSGLYIILIMYFPFKENTYALLSAEMSNKDHNVIQ